jgi:hypothetical protein
VLFPHLLLVVGGQVGVLAAAAANVAATHGGEVTATVGQQATAGRAVARRLACRRGRGSQRSMSWRHAVAAHGVASLWLAHICHSAEMPRAAGQGAPTRGTEPVGHKGRGRGGQAGGRRVAPAATHHAAAAAGPAHRRHRRLLLGGHCRGYNKPDMTGDQDNSKLIDCCFRAAQPTWRSPAQSCTLPAALSASKDSRRTWVGQLLAQRVRVL